MCAIQEKLPLKFPKKNCKNLNFECLSQEINLNKGFQSVFQKLENLQNLKKKQ